MLSNNPILGIMDANHLIKPNFSDWLRILKIFINSMHIAYS